MEQYMDAALFIETEQGRKLRDLVVGNPYGTTVSNIEFERFVSNQEPFPEGGRHVVIAGTLSEIKKVLDMARHGDFSVGIIPLPSQKDLILCYDLPPDADGAVERALRRNTREIDLIYCNGQIVLFKARVGRVPLLDSPVKGNLFKAVYRAAKRLIGMRLLGFDFTARGKGRLVTAASGCMIIQHHTGTMASKLISHDSSLTDGMISLVISAPLSLFNYMKLVLGILTGTPSRKRIAGTTGLIKSPELHIGCDAGLEVVIDDEGHTKTPVHARAVKKAVRVNIGSRLAGDTASSPEDQELFLTRNLPLGKEVVRAKNRVVPFFAYASEERFKALFSALNDDARINSIYLMLMVLSTLLASVGLYLNSGSVIIGAMLIAPLMAPIVSLAMGFLRGNTRLIRASLLKIVIGIGLALMCSALLAWLLPYDPVTLEMQARLNPSLLDLTVAFIAGIAGAYTKSFKEIIQSLAGVAIAVALVPPLAVAGIGLGRVDLYFFAQAFLLFFTNFIGIVLAASLTFRFLGYSPVIRDKRGLAMIFGLMCLIAVPLWFSYDRIVDTHHFERAWRQERFLVNDKYIIVKKAKVMNLKEKMVITMEILGRDRLTRHDMSQLKDKIQRYYSKKIEIRANIIYIL